MQFELILHWDNSNHALCPSAKHSKSQCWCCHRLGSWEWLFNSSLSDCSIVHYTWNPQKCSCKLILGLRNPPLTDTVVRTTSLPSNTKNFCFTAVNPLELVLKATSIWNYSFIARQAATRLPCYIFLPINWWEMWMFPVVPRLCSCHSPGSRYLMVTVTGFLSWPHCQLATHIFPTLILPPIQHLIQSSSLTLPWFLSQRLLMQLK